jgi:hypothetical protein
MSRDSRLEASPSTARAIAEEIPDARAKQAIEPVEGGEFSCHFGPARGILSAMVMGAGAWMIILGAAALARAVIFG